MSAADVQVPGSVLEVRNLVKEYRNENGVTRALDGLDFSIKEFEFVSIVGPSGCGKTTLLNCISGLITPTSGEALLNGESVVEPLPHMAIVFQDYARSLFPWFTVKANVGLPLRGKVGRAQADELVARSLASVGLSGFADHHPWQLSGGMQQRVAIARAIAYRPTILLLDEPFASVDAQTRAELEDLVLRLRTEHGITVLLVTHDIDEAIYMSDRVLIMTRQPSRIHGELPVDLPWPRDQVRTKAEPAFAAARGFLYRSLTAAHSDMSSVLP